MNLSNPSVSRRGPQSRRGMALIVVLSVVALVTLLVVAFFALGRTEYAASSAFASNAQTQLLAEMPTNLVIGQIRKATENLGVSRTWASQPGAIRVFGTQTGSSGTGRASLSAIYKLYSSGSMVQTSNFDPAAEIPPTTWSSTPGIYTDLNEPKWADHNGDGVMQPDELIFPILDPRGAAPVTTGTSTTPAPAIKGFSFDTTLQSGFGLVAPQSSTDTSARVPMPALWLYVLKDGTLATPGTQQGSVVHFTGAVQPSDTNPIVGRIAFWTDDETCKININTASEGVPWDMPRTNNSSDAFLFGDKQPVHGEYSHYPGHPATVCLSTVLSSWLPLRDYPVSDLAPLQPGVAPNSGSTNATGYSTEIARYFALSPRYAQGGSYGGVVNVTSSTSPVIPTKTRLYTTVEEMFYDPQRRNQPLASTSSGTPVQPLPAIAMEQSKFFLTAASRAPEVTLFNTPRVALWPIQNSTQDRNAVDNLIAFCSQTKVGSSLKPYYFQRLSVHSLTNPSNSSSYGSSQSPTQDWSIGRNPQLFSYLQHLTNLSVPGFSSGDTFVKKYPSDRDQILTSMVDYIRSGLNTFAYSPTADSTGQAFSTPRDSRGYSYTPPRQLTSGEAEYGEGQVVPLQIGNYQGFGRWATVTEAALVFFPTSPNVQGTGKPDITVSVPNSANRPAFSAATMRAFLLLEFYCASPGNPPWSPYMTVNVKGLDGLTVNGSNLNFPKGTATMVLQSPVDHIPFNDNTRMGPGNATSFFAMWQPLYSGGNSTSTPIARRNLQSTDSKTGFAWISQSDVPLPKPVAGGTLAPLSFTGGPLTIQLCTPDGSATVQTIQMNFPACQMPCPYIYIPMSGAPDPTQSYTPSQLEYNLTTRIANSSETYCVNLIRPGDVVRSMEAAGMGTGNTSSSSTIPPPNGDLRFFAARNNVPSNWFVEGGVHGTTASAPSSQWDYYNPTTRFAHGLRHGNYWQYWGHFAALTTVENPADAIGGEGAGDVSNHPYYRMASITTGGSMLPCIAKASAGMPVGLYRDAAFVCARGITAAYRADGKLGDFDNGTGNTEDGCYINHPDESNSFTSAQASWAPFVDYGGYYSRGALTESGANALNHSPNRQITSAVAFGSLPSGLNSNRPWETLLFCPNPAGRSTPAFSGSIVQQPTTTDHTGFGFPRDHLLADLFWMPVVEPYAISEPFSTAGKINMNYDILPYRYIKRRTGLYAVLKSTWLSALPPEFAQSGAYSSNLGCYKGGRDQASSEDRYAINPDPTTGTLLAFEDRFNLEKDIFHSATEICDVFLIPQYLPSRTSSNYPKEGQTLPTPQTVMSWWTGTSPTDATGMKLTGDNSREAPYGQLLPRLTTKSNTFTVHYRVQSLQKARSTTADVWDTSKDSVRGEQRGSVLLERYVDPNDPNLPDFATAVGTGSSTSSNSTTVDDYYRVRILRKQIFAP